MPVVRSNPPRAARARHGAAVANPPYANVPFVNPTWPSILSVAHDEANGGRVFVITDRPCAIVAAPSLLTMPLSVAGSGGLDVVLATEIFPIKFRLWLSGPVPRGSAWAWGAGGTGLIDPITGHALNAAAGDCADVPGPYAPAPAASVVAASASGTTAVLTFDRPVTATGSPPDDAVTFNGMTAVNVGNADAYTLSFALPGFVNAGDPWVISRQPDWVAEAILVPEAGVL